MPGCQTGGPRRNILWHNANASQFGLQNIVLQKKSFNLKLHENSHKVIIDNCYKSRVALQVMAIER